MEIEKKEYAGTENRIERLNDGLSRINCTESAAAKRIKRPILRNVGIGKIMQKRPDTSLGHGIISDISNPLSLVIRSPS